MSWLVRARTLECGEIRAILRPIRGRLRRDEIVERQIAGGRRAKAAFRAARFRDYGAFDIRVRADQPYIIDANHNPDISRDSFFHLAIRVVGCEYEHLAGRLVELAAQRMP